MPNKRYVKGRNFEYRVKRYFEAKGYFVVRSAGSKGVFDLIAITDGEVIGIQCKKHGQVSKDELNRIIEVSKKYRIKPRIATVDEKNRLKFVNPFMLLYKSERNTNEKREQEN